MIDLSILLSISIFSSRVSEIIQTNRCRLQIKINTNHCHFQDMRRGVRVIFKFQVDLEKENECHSDYLFKFKI